MHGERLKKIRKEHDLTQAEFGSRLGLSDSTIGMYEKNKREPGIEVLVSISKEFGVSLEWLLTGTIPESTDNLLPKDIKNIVKIYSDLPDRAQEKVKEYIEMVYNAEKNKD